MLRKRANLGTDQVQSGSPKLLKSNAFVNNSNSLHPSFVFTSVSPITMKASDLFSLERQFSFYKSYHTNTINKRIHIVFVPTLIITFLSLISTFRLPPPFVDMSRPFTLFYILYCIALSPKLGLLYTPFLVLFYAASRAFCNYAGPSATVPWALALHFISWFAQIVGHYAFEGKSPAFMDSLLQSFLAAPIVVWLEVVFSLGFMPETKARLQRSRVVAKARKAVKHNTAQ